MSNLRLEPATTADIPAITAIYRHHVLTGTASFEEVPPDEAEMAQRLKTIQERGLPYLCLRQVDAASGPSASRRSTLGDILGYAYASPYRPRSAYRFTVEDSIYVAPDQAGKGYGRLLLERLIEDCRQAERRQMLAVIGDSSNTASIRLHRALGFREVGVFQNVGLKFGRWLDTVLMQLSLVD